MTYRIMDTNILVIANRRNTHATLVCSKRCADLLQELQIKGIVVIDADFRILKEYCQNANQTGQPGIGDAFLLWVLRNRGTPLCELQAITILPSADGSENYSEFPSDPTLHGFDPSDRKFVAVCLAHPARPSIHNAGDSDWGNYRTALEKHGVVVREVC